MVDANIGLARVAARGFLRSDMDEEREVYDYNNDVVQTALLALWKAALTWDETRGVKFSTYAWKLIRRACSHHARRQMAVATLGYEAHKLTVGMKQAANALFILLDREPRLQEIADYMGLPLKEVEDIYSANATAFDMDMELGNDVDAGAGPKDSDGPRNLHEALGTWDPHAANHPGLPPELRPWASDEDLAELRARLVSAMDEAGLTDRQKEALVVMYLDGVDKRTQRETAEIMGVTRQRIRALVDTGLAKLRDHHNNRPDHYMEIFNYD